MKLGIIAGNRLFPLIFSKSAKEKNEDLEIVAICFYGETNPRISRYVDKTFWLRVGQLGKLVEIIKRQQLNEIVMVGQISPRSIFKRKHWDDKMLGLIDGIDDFRPHTVFSQLMGTLETLGIKFIDSTTYMKDCLAKEGLMNDLVVDDDTWGDINFGLGVVSKFVELDVGQSIAVKKKAVITLEALEGTDRMILRAYHLAKKRCVILKFSKKDQDLRFDVPIVGINTLKVLKRAGSSALVLEKDRVIILEKDKFLRQARCWGIPVIGKDKISQQ